MPFPMFGMGGGPSGADSEQDGAVQGDGSIPPSSPPPPPSASTEPSNTNEWGDPWLTDEQAGVSNPDDNDSGFFDNLTDFFGGDE